MIWGKFTKEEKEGSGSLCQWFAWHPVRLRDGRWVWWETVWLHEWTSQSFGGRGHHYEPYNKKYS